MKLIKPSYEILNSSVMDESIITEIEKAARTCYQSEGKIELGNRASNGELYDLEPISGKKLVKKLLERGHEAMLEFGPSITVRFICDRGVSHELVRHRLASFAQESTRYCNYGNDEHITFIIPEWANLEEKIWTELGVDSNDGNVSPIFIWMRQMIRSEKYYNQLIALKWSPQQARSVLPNSLKTEINIKANIREWRHIFKMRCPKTAHPQMRELMIPLLADFQKKIPILFDDIKAE